MIKAATCGFRNRKRFINMVLLQLGGLSLYPAAASATHTNS